MTRERKKTRGGRRPSLTHFEIRRGGTLRLRIAVADDALAGVGDELGALIRKIAPAVRTSVVTQNVPSLEAPASAPVIEVVSAEPSSDFVVTPEHRTDDDAYHKDLRERLSELFGSLCDCSLDDALEIARNERARRAEGGN